MTRQYKLCREQVWKDFPWAIQSGQKMVVGTDLDAILSSALAYHYKRWELIGFYDLENIYTAASVSDLCAAIWLDLDISRRDIKSIGHHVLMLDDTPIPQLRNSLNPNLLRPIARSMFTHKYPLATFHFLCWLWDVTPPIGNNNLALALYWLPDSAFINAQSDMNGKRHYRANVYEWLEYMDIFFLRSHIDVVDTLQFEQSVEQLIHQFVQLGWSAERGQVSSTT